MNALACSERGTNAQIDIAFEDFMSSGHMHNRAKAAMCSPDDLIVDYLPAFDVSVCHSKAPTAELSKL